MSDLRGSRDNGSIAIPGCRLDGVSISSCFAASNAAAWDVITPELRRGVLVRKRLPNAASLVMPVVLVEET